MISQETPGVVDSALPAPWKYDGVGLTNALGVARVAAEYIEVGGASTGVRGTEDSGNFLHQAWRGDGVWVARVVEIYGSNGWAAAGLMVRTEMDASAPNVFLALINSGGVTFHRRATAQGLTDTDTLPVLPLPDGRAYQAKAGRTQIWTNDTVGPGKKISAPCWLKFVRQGDDFSGYVSVDGANWLWVGTETVRMTKPEVQVGLVTTRQDASGQSVARFDLV